MKLPKWLLTKLYNIFVEGRLRFIGKPLFGILVSIELAAHQVLTRWDMKGGYTNQDDLISELSIIIKTFERPKAIRRLVNSIKTQYPNLKIIIADDSRRPQSIRGVEVIHLPYNQGATIGRNEALNRVKTKYFLLLDDDFVFFKHTKLVPALSIIESHPEIDIIGGEVVDLPFFTVGHYQNAKLFPTNSQPIVPPGTKIGGLPVYNMVANFFLGRTDRVKLVGWDPELKNLAHADFFTRAVGVLTTVFCSDLKVLHARTPFDSEYMKNRNDVTFDRAILLYRYGYTSPDSRDDKTQLNSE